MNTSFMKMLVLGLPALVALQATASTEQQITLSGTLIEPATCQFNGGIAVEVNFGSEIIPRKIDGVNYVQEFTVNAVCEGNVTNDLRMRFWGSPPNFDTKAVGLTAKNLGVALYNGDKQIGVREWFNITAPQSLKIKAVLIRKPDVVIPGGAFSGYVNMVADYR